MNEIAVKKEVCTLLSHRESKELINTGELRDKDGEQTLFILWLPGDHLQFILANALDLYWCFSSNQSKFKNVFSFNPMNYIMRD